MIYLVPKSFKQISAIPNMGMLFTPTAGGARMPAKYEAAGIPFAADNGCYQGGLDVKAWLKMLSALVDTHPLFITCPDVVSDHAATRELWDKWAPLLHNLGGPAAFILQDGIQGFEDVPEDADAVFIGGSTEFKMGDIAREIIAAANEKGLWTHMGRVNSVSRIEYAGSIGCDSVDGSRVCWFWDDYAEQYASTAAKF